MTPEEHKAWADQVAQAAVDNLNRHVQELKSKGSSKK